MIMSDINDVFGVVKATPPEEEYKPPNLTVFDFINSINYNKNNLMVDEWSERQYASYIVNRGLSFTPDTILQANEVNFRPNMDKKLQYDFLINIVRPKKRYTKWIKAEKIEAMDIVKAYYGYSTEKAYQALTILSDKQVEALKEKLYKGGGDVRRKIRS
jgi:hypothetical protein